MNITLNIHDHKEGGSMVCNEEKQTFNYIPSEDEIKHKIEQHKKEYSVDIVYFNLYGVV